MSSTPSASWKSAALVFVLAIAWTQRLAAQTETEAPAVGVEAASPVAVGSPAVAPPVAEAGPAQRYVEARRVDRLEASLAEHANADSLVRRWGGVGALVLGGALIAGGILVAVEDEGWGIRGRAAVSGAAWTAGASLIGVAIYRWTGTTPAEDRFARWNQLRSAGKLDLFEFARFEGELASEAELARFNRGLSAFGSFGLAAGGGGLIALGASGELGKDGSTDAYILGGVMVGVGVIQSIALFWQRTPAERAWKHYSEGGGGFFSGLRLRPLEL